MLLITYAGSDANIDRAIGALRRLSSGHADGDHGPLWDIPDPVDLRQETVMLPRDAYLGATEMVNWREAAGRISAEMICPYPPGLPITAPGEQLTDDVVVYLGVPGLLERVDELCRGASPSKAAHARMVSRPKRGHRRTRRS